MCVSMSGHFVYKHFSLCEEDLQTLDIIRLWFYWCLEQNDFKGHVCSLVSSLVFVLIICFSHETKQGSERCESNNTTPAAHWTSSMKCHILIITRYRHGESNKKILENEVSTLPKYLASFTTLQAAFRTARAWKTDFFFSIEDLYWPLFK